MLKKIITMAKKRKGGYTEEVAYDIIVKRTRNYENELRSKARMGMPLGQRIYASNNYAHRCL